MIKKIMRWVLGMIQSFIGWLIFNCALNVFYQFENMINFTGKEFVWCFVFFVSSVVGFVFFPYFLFNSIERSNNDRQKDSVQTIVEPMEEDNDEET